jgi:hypothetical protein
VKDWLFIPAIIIAVSLFSGCIGYAWRKGYLSGIKKARRSRRIAKESAK